MRDNAGDQELAIPVQLHPGRWWRDSPCHLDSHAFVAARGQPGRLAGGVDTSHLHRHRSDSGQTQHQNHHQRGDRQRRLNSARAGTRR